MAQQEHIQEQGRTGLYLSPMAQRRADFAAACGPLFARLDAVDGIDGALAALDAGQLADQPAHQPAHQPDLLVLDLERFEPSLDVAALGALIARRAGAPTLLLCPYAGAAWLPALMAFGPVAYAVTPLAADAVHDVVARSLQAYAPAAPAAEIARLRGLLALRARVQETLAEADDPDRLADALCEALRSWPGVQHAAVLLLKAGGDLQLAAQQGESGLLLGTLLQRTDRLLQAPLRHAFPGLLAAASGETVLLEAPEQAGEPALAEALRAHGVGMALGLPIPADGPAGIPDDGATNSYAAPRGALSLLFTAPRSFTPDEWTTLGDIARLAARGLHACALAQENEHLLARLTHISSTDALTGVSNRRHGEELLQNEIKRARRYRVPLALLSFDIDRFKAVNDTFGYPVGDVALRTVAETARAVLRASDMLVRSGGEEFHIIAPHTSAIDGLKMAEKVRVAVEQAEIPGCDHVTVSLGVAQLGEQESADLLMQRADAAMARAKRAGRNCVELAMQ
jgi:diguanylate cyclase (GGDEF)-like protein